MEYRPLGKTGFQVSVIALGTVELGQDYGIEVPGAFGQPTEAEALRIVQAAADAGVNLFDTAPTYGNAERILGRALGDRDDCWLATKVTIPPDGTALEPTFRQSIERSLRRLRRDVLDLVELHNATVEVLADRVATDALLELREEGLVRHVGASVYGEEAAQTVLRDGRFGVLQAAFSMLDQRLAVAILPAAAAASTAFLARSVLLRGVLTPKARWLPNHLDELRAAAARICDVLGLSWEELPQIAIRYCCHACGVSSVLVGVRSSREVGDALDAVGQGPLPADMISAIAELGITDESLLNPTNWSSR